MVDARIKRLASRLGPVLLRGMGRTWRTYVHHPERLAAITQSGGSWIFAAWHASLFVNVHSHRGQGITILVSWSDDGELISRVLVGMGFGVVRGSSSRGGREGLFEMATIGKGEGILGVTVDGPRGPAYEVKEGIVWLAARTGRPIVPIGLAARPAFRLRSWDRLIVPWPGSRIDVVYGPPIRVPRRITRASAAEIRGEVQAAMEAATREAETGGRVAAEGARELEGAR